MRLLTRRIHRAFPELDRYGDEQCLRFVKAARGSRLRRLAGLAAACLFGVVCAISMTIAVAFTVDRLIPRYDLFETTPVGFLVGVAGIILLISLAPVSAFLARDFLLRRRVRFILRSRGVCLSCWYSLIGLPIGPGNTIHCPECGATTTVDPSLSELVTDPSGQRRFQPEVGHVDLGQCFWTPRRKRTLKRAALWGTATLALILLVLIGGNELLIRRQARAARAAMVGVEGMLAHVRAHQPPGADDPSAANAYDVLARTNTIREDADAREWKSAQQRTAAGNSIDPDFSLLYRDERARSARPIDDQEREAACRALALHMLDAYAADGLNSALAELATCRRAVRPITLGPDEPAFAVMLPDLGTTRSLARICAARMTIAREHNDRDSFIAAFEQGLALARIVRHQPFIIDGMVANAVESLMFNQLVDALQAPIPPEWLDGVAAAMARQRTDVPITFQLEGERISSTDSIAWVFSNPSRARFGRFSPALAQQFGSFGVSTPTSIARLGSFEENARVYTGIIEAEKLKAASDPWNRPSPSTTYTPGSLLLIDLLVPSFGRLVGSADQLEAQRRGIITLVALERFRAHRGHVPASLSELIPEFLDKLPLDPWSGKPFIYKPLAAPDEHGRTYLLYSVGADGKDDGGVSGEQSRKQSGNLTVGPSDVIINEVDPPRSRP
jgi:hypothetical protein